MSKSRRFKLEGLRTTDWKVMEEHYRNMAQKGFFIKKVKFGVSVYEKGQPKEEEYAVGIYPQPKAFETVDKHKVEEYVNSQKEKGWDYVYSQEHIHVFKTSGNQALESLDTEAQIDNIKKNIKLENISFISLIILNIFNMWRAFPITPSWFYTNTSLFALLLLPMISLILLISIIENTRVWLQIKDKTDADKFPKMNLKAVLISRKIQMVVSAIIIILLLTVLSVDSIISGNMLILTIAPVLLGMIVAFKLRGFFRGKGMGTIKKTVLAFIIVFMVVGLMTIINMRVIPSGFGDDLPEGYLALEVDNPDSKSFRREGSILVPTRYSYREWKREESVSTEVTGYMNSGLAGYFYSMELDAETRYFREYWDAKEWYPEYDQASFVTFTPGEMEDSGTLILRSENYIISLSMDEDLRDDQVISKVNELVERIVSKQV